jgi:predicted nucleic acid-binding protein
VHRFLSGFDPLPITETQVIQATRIDAALASQGLTIGSGDVWIAVAALEEGVPVLTANVNHFARIPGLKVIGYAILP